MKADEKIVIKLVPRKVRIQDQINKRIMFSSHVESSDEENELVTKSKQIQPKTESRSV